MIGVNLLHRRVERRLWLLLALAGGLALLWLRKSALYGPGFGFAGSHDFIEYWSAARLLWHGGNPYDPATLLAVERAAGWPEPQPLLMWNPPWTLVLVLPLALLPFGLATVVWLLLRLGLVLGSGVLLWRYFAPGDGRYWIGLALAAGFVPGLFALQMGQISPWLLAGVVGFLWAERSQRDVLAGGALALLMIKPHIAYLFWLAALGWAWWSRRRGVLMGWLAALIAASGLVLLFAPDIFTNYLAAAARPPLYWATPTLGTWLRLFFGLERRWLQFLPSLVGGLALLVWWFWRRRRLWRWEAVAAPLLLASASTAAFGWSLDQVVLLPAVVDLVGRLRTAPTARKATVLGVLAAFQCALLVQNLHEVNDVFYIWHPLALAGLFLWGGTRHRARGAKGKAIGVENLDRGKTLITAGRVADTFWGRLRGLMGSKPLAPGEGLLIVPCNSVHTHFMRFPIDVLYVDGAQEVIGIDENLPPWRFGRPRRQARFVIELPAGTVKATGTRPGDRLRVQGYEFSCD